MHIDDLRTVELIVELGSFARAAEYLNMAQSAISNRVRQVEREFGLALFVKDGRRVKPTPAGELVVELARRLDRDLVSLRESLALLKDFNSTLRIGTPPSGPVWIIPVLLAAVRRRHPSLDMEVIPVPRREIATRLRHGALDLGVECPPDPDLVSELIFSRSYYLFASAGHPLAGVPNASVADITCWPFVAEPPGTASRPILDRWARLHGLNLRVVFQTTGSSSQLAAIRENLGVGLLLENAAAMAVRNGELAMIRAPGLPQHRDLTISYRRDGTRTRAADLFLEVLRNREWVAKVPRLPSDLNSEL